MEECNKIMNLKVKQEILVVLIFPLLTCCYLRPALAQGVPFNVYGYVKDDLGNPIAGASIIVQSPIDQKSTTTDSQGRYAVTLSINGPGDSITVTAIYDGRSGSASGTVPSSTSSMQIDITISRLLSSITCSVSPYAVAKGETVTVSGSISPAHGVTVTLTYKKSDDSTFTRTTSASSEGRYSDTYTPDIPGSWGVKASWSGDTDHKGAESSWASFTVTKKYSSISISVSPSDIRPAQSVSISGSISPLQAGASVTVSWRREGGSWSTLTTVTSDSSGAYSYTWTSTPTELGTYQVRAYWPGDADYEGTEATATLRVTKPPSEISININTTSITIGQYVLVSGSIAPARTGVAVKIAYTRPDGTIVTRSVMTDANSNYEDVYLPDRNGTWTVQASWLGDEDYLGASSKIKELIVRRNPSNLTLSLYKTSITIDEPIVASGSISPPHPEADVILTYTKPDGGTVTRIVKTDSQSHFSDTYSPDQAGSWNVRAYWSGDRDHDEAYSSPSPFTVIKKPSEISLLMSPPVVKKGDEMTITGNITPSHSNVSVTIHISEDGGSSWSTLTSLASNAEGTYQYSWTLTKTGVFLMKSSWQGDRDHDGSVSDVITTTVGETTQTVDVTLPSGNSSEVLASSNSSAIFLSVNASEKKISVNATGPSGTTGILTIFIQDEILREHNSDVGDVLFTVDGREVTPQIDRITRGYLVTLTYSHSSRTINIYLVTYQVVVKILDHEGKPFSSNAVVNVTGPVLRSVTTNQSGIVVFTRVPIGSYKIQVYYGPKVGQDLVEITGDKILTINTVIGKIEAEYTELQNKYQALTIELNTTRNIMYAFVITTIVFIAATVYFARKRKST